MPSVAAHFVVAKKVSKILNIDNDDFLKGNILPDIAKNKGKSHYMIKGKYFEIPNIDDFLKYNNYNKYTFLGYLTHLLLDLYFLDEFIPSTIDKCEYNNLFNSNIMYDDYSYINYKLVTKYKLETSKISDIIMSCSKDISSEKSIKENIKYINNKEIGEPKLLDFDKFCCFLDDVSKRIADYIEKWC